MSGKKDASRFFQNRERVIFPFDIHATEPLRNPTRIAVFTAMLTACYRIPRGITPVDLCLYPHIFAPSLLQNRFRSFGNHLLMVLVDLI